MLKSHSLPNSTAISDLLEHVVCDYCGHDDAVSLGHLPKGKMPLPPACRCQRQLHELWFCCLLAQGFPRLSIQDFRHTLKQTRTVPLSTLDERTILSAGNEQSALASCRTSSSRFSNETQRKKMSTTAERRNRTSNHTRIREILATCG